MFMGMGFNPTKVSKTMPPQQRAFPALFMIIAAIRVQRYG